MSNGTAIEFQNVSKSYGRFEAIKQIAFSIKDNEFFTLLGPSGCGKTTLLRMIAGFEKPTRGEIVLHGENIQNLPAHKRRVNTVFQNYALFPHMTLAKNIAFGLERLGWAEADIKQRVAEMLEMVHMSAFSARLPHQLSGGQQQRIALARALAPKPEVLLLDEPLSALDLKLRQSMRDELQKLQRQTGITFVFVTHDQEEALAMSDRICVLAEGHIQQMGSPMDIYENPNNRFVADFIGETNFLPVTVTAIDGEMASVETPMGLNLSAPCRGVSTAGEATLSLRPEKISINDPTQSVQLQGKVQHATYMGGYTHYTVETQNAVTLRVSKRNTVSNDINFARGSSVTLGFKPDSVRVLGQ